MEVIKLYQVDDWIKAYLKSWGYEDDKLVHKPDIVKSAKVIKKLISRYDISAYVVDREQEGKQLVTKLYITEPEDVRNLYRLMDEVTYCDNCLVHFLTGVFVSDGILVDPKKEYHLEFTYKDENLARNLLNTLKFAGFEIIICCLYKKQ